MLRPPSEYRGRCGAHRICMEHSETAEHTASRSKERQAPLLAACAPCDTALRLRLTADHTLLHLVVPFRRLPESARLVCFIEMFAHCRDAARPAPQNHSPVQVD